MLYHDEFANNVFHVCCLLNPKSKHRSFIHSLIGICVALVHWLRVSLKSLRGSNLNLMSRSVPLLLPIAGLEVFNSTPCNWATTPKISYLNIKLQDINITKLPPGTSFLIAEAKEQGLFLLREEKV